MQEKHTDQTQLKCTSIPTLNGRKHTGHTEVSWKLKDM